MVTIGVEQSLSNSVMYKHRCLENIKKLYRTTGKCDDQQQYKAILETAIVSTPEEFTDNSPMSPSQSVTVKKPSARKPLRQFWQYKSWLQRWGTSGFLVRQLKTHQKAIKGSSLRQGMLGQIFWGLAWARDLGEIWFY